MKPSNNISAVRVVLKALVLFIIINLAFAFIPFSWGKVTLYGSLFPARPRFPFGENPRQAYNLSLFDLNAMFASHEVSAPTNADFRVFVVGDSSVWGIMLHPEETLSAQLNTIVPQICGKPAHYYNLGYPTASLMKDLMILDSARAYQPDLILWVTTLESFPLDKQVSSPIVVHNPERINDLIARYALPVDSLPSRTYWQRTFWSRRRDLADIIRLQLYGFMWAGTGADQIYPEAYPAAQTDFDADPSFHGQDAALSLDPTQLAFSTLDAGFLAAGAPVILINEPMLISSGKNSDIRYNFFYPRWAYDDYRNLMKQYAAKNNRDYLDAWDIIPATEFTNSAIHLTPRGETLFAKSIADYLDQSPCPK